MRAILTYHSIDSSGSVISVDESTFADHVRFLTSGRVKVVPLRELLSLSDDENAVALTFDDGFANFETAAWPLLREAGLPATVYVVTDQVGRSNLWGGQPEPEIPELPLMGWNSLARLAEEGLELGGHGRRHRRLEGLDAEALHDEIAGSKERIASETGHEAFSFAYPYGDYDEAAVSAARAHFEAACTTRLGTLGSADDPLTLSRLDAFYLRDAGKLDRYGSPAFARFVRRRAVLREVRRRAERMLPGGRRS